jgi:hypothetical protein
VGGREERESECFHHKDYKLTPVILAPQEAEIRRIVIQSQPRKIVHKTLSQKNSSQKWAGGVVRGVGPEFEPQYCQKKRKKEMTNF